MRDWKQFHEHFWIYKASRYVEHREGFIDLYVCFCHAKLYGERKRLFQEPDGKWRERPKTELVHPDNPDFRTTVLGEDEPPQYNE